MNIKMCECESPMSYFEEENFGKCGACHQKDTQMEMQRQAEEARKREEERLERERLGKEQKLKESRERIKNILKYAVGKTIEDVEIGQWSHDYDDEAKAVTLYFTDGSNMSFSQEEAAVGCRGCYDYYHYLDIDFSESWS